jgi:proteasome lid subunit RPN8/RPN11
MSMEKFSDHCKTLGPSMAIDFEEALKPWMESFPHGYTLVELPESSVGICTKIAVEVGSDSLLLVGEPVVIGVSSPNLECEAPFVFPDRLSFPFSRFPHINFAHNGLPNTLCLTREPIEEWYAEHTFGEYVDMVGRWLNDAAHGTLMKLRQGDSYEPFRVENTKGVLIIDGDIDKYIVGLARPFSCYTSVDYDTSVGIEKFYDPMKDGCKDNGLEIIISRSCEDIIYDWFIQYPTTLGELLKFAKNNGFVIEQEKILSLLSADLCPVEKLFFRFAFIRPKNLIGKDTPVDYLCYCVAKEDFIKQNFDASIDRIMMLDKVTREYANKLTETTEMISGKKILILGCGAIGSKLIYHLYRSGITNLTICDKDVMMPHNICRHALTVPSILKNKAELVRDSVDKMFYFSCPIKIVKDDLLKWLPQTNLNEYDVIIDATASASVARCLDNVVCNLTIPVIRFALSDSGRIGLVYINNDRSVSLVDYYMQLLREAIEDDDISDWFKDERRYNYDYVRVGEGCHSNTMKINDDVISAHTALAARIIRNLFDKCAKNIAYLSFADLDFQGSMFSLKYIIPSFEKFTCQNNSQWEVRIPSDLSKYIKTEAKVGGKREVGEYMMGYVDTKYHRIYVLDSFKPQDSLRKTNRIELGKKGWKEHKETIGQRTASMMSYLGDWHSHPSGSLLPSNIDEATFEYLITNEIAGIYGLGLITNTHEVKAYLLNK